jgi:hypothetical protein
MKHPQKNKSPLVQAAIALMQARNLGMITCEEWENLAKAVEAECGKLIEWRTTECLGNVVLDPKWKRASQGEASAQSMQINKER